MHGSLCQILKNRPATIHLTAIDEDGSVVEIHLSAAAVRKLGIDLQQQPPGAQAIRDWLDQAAATAGDAQESASSLALKAPTLLVPSGVGSARCDHCGLDYQEFIETNRFGCPGCYDAFAGRLDRALKDLHGHNRHIGRVPRDEHAPESQLRMERDQLRRRLANAVADEAYEVAAEVRDRLRRVESDLDHGEESAEDSS